MHRVTSLLSAVVFGVLLFAGGAYGQDNPSLATVTCNISDDQQLVVDYQQVAINPKKALGSQIPFGRVWVPGGRPITLFTNVRVRLGPMELPIGAYTMFVIPNVKQWTLIVSKSTNITGNYDESQDLIRVPMDAGELPTPETSLAASFEHGPDQCTFRLDLEKYGHFVTFQKR